LTSIRTLGGHRRYLESEVKLLLDGSVPQQRDRRQGWTASTSTDEGTQRLGAGFLCIRSLCTRLTGTAQVPWRPSP